MQLQSVKVGDIIRIDDGLQPYFAMAMTPPESGRLSVRGLHGSKSIRRVTARDVTGIWHQSKRTDPNVAFKH